MTCHQEKRVATDSCTFNGKCINPGWCIWEMSSNFNPTSRPRSKHTPFCKCRLMHAQTHEKRKAWGGHGKYSWQNAKHVYMTSWTKCKQWITDKTWQNTVVHVVPVQFIGCHWIWYCFDVCIFKYNVYTPKREVRLFQPPSQKGLERTTKLPRLCTFKNCPSKNQDSVDKQSPYKIPHQLGWLTHRKKWDIHLIKNIKACWIFVNQKFLWNGNLSPPMPHPTLWSLSGIKSARVSLSSTTWARRY